MYEHRMETIKSHYDVTESCSSDTHEIDVKWCSLKLCCRIQLIFTFSIKTSIVWLVTQSGNWNWKWETLVLTTERSLGASLGDQPYNTLGIEFSWSSSFSFMRQQSFTITFWSKSKRRRLTLIGNEIRCKLLLINITNWN